MVTDLFVMGCDAWTYSAEVTSTTVVFGPLTSGGPVTGYTTATVPVTSRGYKRGWCPGGRQAG